MLPQGEVSKKVPLSRANRERALQKVFSDFAKEAVAASCGGRSEVIRDGGREADCLCNKR